jgi:hypothetical protein
VDRRGFLKRGVWGTALLAVGGGLGLGLWPTRAAHQPTRALRTLDNRGFAILAAIAARTVRAPGSNPVEIAHRADATLALAPVEAQTEFRQLLGLFDNGLVGMLLDGRPRPFTRLDGDEQDRVLDAWRRSHLVLRRSGYTALRKITLAAHYSQDSSWESVGYGGPPKIST